MKVKHAAGIGEQVGDALGDCLLQVGGCRLGRDIHAEIDHGRAAEAADLAIRDKPFPDEGSSSGLRVDQPAPARLVEGPCHGRQIDAERFRNGTLRRKAITRMNLAGADVCFEGFDDAQIFHAGAVYEPRSPGRH